MSTAAYIKEITLPSLGQFYGEKLPTGVVTIEPMGTREEKLFAGGRGGTVILNKIFDSCVHLPEGMKHQELLLGDRLFLLIQIRCISYGSDYTYHYRCEHCGRRASDSIKLDEIPVNNPKNDELLVEVKLPLLEKTLHLRYLTGEDDEKVEQYAKQIQRKGGNTDNETVYRLARRIEKIDGDVAGIREAMNLAESLKGLDSLAISDALNEFAVGPELEVFPVCNLCGYENGDMMLPIDKHFFRPSRRGSNRRGDPLSAIPTDANR